MSGDIDSFTCTQRSPLSRVVAEGTYLGALVATGEQLLDFATQHPDIPHAQRAITVIQREEVSERRCRKTSYVVLAARLYGDDGYPPDGSRWIILSRVSNADAWAPGAGGSEPFAQLAAHLGVALRERVLSINVDYLGGDPTRATPLGGCSAVIEAAALSLQAPRTGSEVLRISPGDMVGLSLGDHDRMKSLIQRSKWGATGAAAGAMLAGTAGEFVDPGPTGSGWGDEGALAGLLIASAASFMATKTARNHFVLLAGQRDDFRYQTAFLAEPEDARRLVSELQAQRFAHGLPSLPAVEDLVHHDALREQEKQTDVLRSALASGAAPEQDDPITLIERLAILRDKGLVSEDEFEAKRLELLDRI